MTSADIALLRRETELQPLEAAPWRALGLALQASSPGDEATACLCAAMALETRSPLALYNLATVYLQAGRPDQAERWYRLTLALDPELVAANQNLATLLTDQGRHDEAQHHRDRAFSCQSVFVEPAEAPGALRILVLSNSAAGNVPIDYLLPRDRYTRIKWFADYAPTETLPTFDLVFNALGDGDVATTAIGAASRFLQSCDKPILNPPARVLRTTRDQIPELLGSIEGLVVPRTIRAAGADELPIDLGFPILVRPIGSHGGKGVVLVETADALASAPAGPCYLTRYHEYRSPDGLYRKYRVIFIDRKPYPYHLAISGHWLVHYFSSDMATDAARREEEARFLEAPELCLGTSAWNAVARIGQSLDLDYAGVDFALLPDGNVLVFEANATMLAHLGDDAALFAYKHRFLPKLFEAFHRLVDETARSGL